MSFTDASYDAQPEKRQLQIGGLTLGGPKGGISGDGINLPGNKNGQQVAKAPTVAQGQQPATGQTQGLPLVAAQPSTAEGTRPTTTEGQTPSGTQGQQPATTTILLPDGSTLVGSVKPASGASTTEGTNTQAQRPQGLTQPAPQQAAQPSQATSPEGSVPLQVAQPGKPAPQEGSTQQGNRPTEGQGTTGNLATQQAEQFSDNAGITVDKNGNTRNLGGDLGITVGTDGSKSVGGEDGINVGKKWVVPSN